MSGRLVYLLIIIFWCVVVNAWDFVREYRGDSGFTKHQSGFLGTLVMLLSIPGVALGLEGTPAILTLIVLYIVYITFYILIYLKIKHKEERDKDENE